jgi:exonuclease SbcC
VVQADTAVLERFDRRVTDLGARVGNLGQELDLLAPQLSAAVAASERAQYLSVEVAKLEGSERRLPEVKEALETCRKQYAELSGRVAGGATLDNENQSLQREIVRLQSVAGEAARLGVLEEQQQRDREGLEARRSDRRRIDDEVKGRAAAEAEVQRLMTELQRLGDPRGRQKGLEATAFRLGDIEATLSRHQIRLQEYSDKLRATVAELHRFEGLDERIAQQQAIEQQYQEDYELYLQNKDEASQLDVRRAALTSEEEALAEAVRAEATTRAELDRMQSEYDRDEHDRVKELHTRTAQELATAQSEHRHWVEDLAEIDKELQRARLQEQRMARKLAEKAELETAGTAVRFIRDTIRAAGPAVTETLLQNISAVANDIYAEIMDDHAAELRWDRDYEVVVRRGPDDRKFAQLSGGEQMSAALAVRLALLKEMSGVDMAFFDEPTQNMDSDRRVNLASQIRAIHGFNQLIVISHDDTFEHHTDNLIRLHKEEDETVVEA